MKSAFPLINDLVDFLKPLDTLWCVSGGWAIDIHLERITRKRGDLDITVPYSNRMNCLEFFLEKGWRIEGKSGGGFKTIQTLADYNDDIHYFWSFQKDADFISEYIDDNGTRRISYNREFQNSLDYIEVFFDRIEDSQFIYRRDPQVRRQENRAILEKDGVKYLAPELVLLYKSKTLSVKNVRDFQVATDSLDDDSRNWLIEALTQVYDSSHVWLDKLKKRNTNK